MSSGLEPVPPELARVSYQESIRCWALLWHGMEVVPIGPSGRRHWPNRAELIEELGRYGLHVDVHGYVKAEPSK